MKTQKEVTARIEKLERWIKGHEASLRTPARTHWEIINHEGSIRGYKEEIAELKRIVFTNYPLAHVI